MTACNMMKMWAFVAGVVNRFEAIAKLPRVVGRKFCGVF